MLYVIGTAVVVYTPYFIWAIYNGVEVFGFLSIFFGTKPEWATNAVKSFRRSDSALKEFAYLFYTGNGIVITVSFLIPLYHFIRTRAKDRPHNYIFLMTVYLAGVMVVWHITNPRHTITLLPLIAFLFGYALHQIVTNKIAIQSHNCIPAYYCRLFMLIKCPIIAKSFNAPVELLELAEIIQKDNTLRREDPCNSCLRYLDVYPQAGYLAVSQFADDSLLIYSKNNHRINYMLC